jgi:hypothetical protein
MEMKIGMIAGILSIAMLLLDPAMGGDRERPPVHLPFEAWAAETATERQLDSLISEVVALLEQGDVRFSRWRSRDIDAEFGMLRLAVPRTTEGRYIGRNFLFDSTRIGVHFRARFGLRRLRLFVPSACRERVRAGRRGDEVRVRGEDFPRISAHEPLDRGEIRRRWRAVVFAYEMECGDTVRIRFYDSETQRRHERRDGDAGQRTAVDNFWTGVTIFRPVD